MTGEEHAGPMVQTIFEWRNIRSEASDESRSLHDSVSAAHGLANRAVCTGSSGRRELLHQVRDESHAFFEGSQRNAFVVSMRAARVFIGQRKR